MVIVDIGDRTARMRVIVHELVGTFEGLRRDQRFVAIPIRVAQGDTAEWTLPAGAFWIKFLPMREGAAPPTITVHGNAGCAPNGDGLRAFWLPVGEYGRYCLVRPGAASVTVGHGTMGETVVEGWLLLERVDDK